VTKRRAKQRKHTRAYLPAVAPHEAWLESDSYDRSAWRQIVEQAPSVASLLDSGERLIPHFAAFAQDLFCALFKYNVAWRDCAAVRSSTALNRIILQRLLASPAFLALRERTVLEEDKAAVATLVLSQQTLELIRSERLVNRRDMLELWDLERQENEVSEWAAALKNAREMAEQSEFGPESETARTAHTLEEVTKRAAQVSEARLNQKSRRLEEAFKQIRHSELGRLELQSAELAKKIEQVAEDAHQVGLEFSSAARLSAAERLELGRRLAKNPRLGELARLIGRFKQVARAIRRRTLDRGASEVYDITRGADIGRLIPAELLALGTPQLRAEFKRRLLEGTLLQYQLCADEEKGKGPMIVCLDVSSSMTGEKELWAKALTLTLLDIARRRRRLFCAVLFSAGSESQRIFHLNRERRYEPVLKEVLDLAEYFPGGGTDFESPLSAAIELLQRKALKRADIVFITDGECEVSPQWLAQFTQTKHELEFTLFAVLVDVGSNRLSTLAQLADRTTSVSRLTAESTRSLFLEV
jgi:uncharacterized protein with von Willebrand factor type A (vWA) domain